MQTIRLLHGALIEAAASGGVPGSTGCHWVRMAPIEVAAVKEKAKAVPAKARKERSDKGKPRGKRATNSSGGRRAKRVKQALAQSSSSREFVASSDDDSDESDEE